MTFQDFLMNSPSGGLMIKVGDGTPIGGLPPWITSDTVNGGLMFKVNAAGYTPPDGMLQTGTALNATLQVVNDNVGTDSALQLSTTQINFGPFAGAATGNILWRANGTLTEYTGWHQSDGEYRFITKNGSPVFFNIAYGINFSNGFGSTGRSNIDGSGNWSIGGSITNAARLHVKGDGTNPIQRWESGAGVNVASIDNAGVIYVGNNATANYGKIYETGGHLVLWANGGSGKNLILSNLNTTYTQNNNWNPSGNGAHSFSVGNYSGVGSFAAFTLSTGLAISSVGSGNPHVSEYLYTINNTAAQTGTATGIFLNATETALNGMAHNLMDLQRGGSSQFYVSRAGDTYTKNRYYFMPNNDYIEGSHNSGFTQIVSGQNIQIVPNGFAFKFLSTGIMQFGGTTNAFPAIKRNGAAIDFRLADDSGYANITAQEVGANVGFFAPNSTELRGTYLRARTSTFIGFADSTQGIVVDSSATTPSASAIFQANSTTKGFLMPRQTTAQINAISTPAEGLQVYNTDLAQPCFYDGTGWRKISHTNM